MSLSPKIWACVGVYSPGRVFCKIRCPSVQFRVMFARCFVVAAGVFFSIGPMVTLRLLSSTPRSGHVMFAMFITYTKVSAKVPRDPGHLVHRCGAHNSLFLGCRITMVIIPSIFHGWTTDVHLKIKLFIDDNVPGLCIIRSRVLPKPRSCGRGRGGGVYVRLIVCIT